MLSTNIGAYITTRFAIANTAVTAGTLANTDGVKIDRTAVRPLHLSGKLQIGYSLTIPSGQSSVITASVRHAETENGAYATIATANVEVVGLNDGSEQTGVVEVDVNLIGAHAWLQNRVSVAPGDGTGSGVTGAVFGLFTVGGGETIPPTESPIEG